VLKLVGKFELEEKQEFLPTWVNYLNSQIYSVGTFVDQLVYRE